MKRPGRLLIMITTFIAAMGSAHAAVTASIADQGETVHLELSGQANWAYSLKNADQKGKRAVELTIDPLDPKAAEALKSFKSDLVRKVSVNTAGPDGRTVLSFEMSGDQVETFDYLTDQPSRLIVDFYLSPDRNSSPLKKSAPTSKVKAPNLKSETKVQPQVAFKTGDSRAPATSDAITVEDRGPLVAQPENSTRAAILDGSDPDYSRFSIKDYEIKEEAILRSKDNYFIAFPMMMTRPEAFDRVRASYPVYSITPKDDAENKLARLLLTLFERKRWSVYLKTLEWFTQKYPESKYNELVSFMTADVYLHRWEEEGKVDDYERAVQAYQSAISRFPSSPTAEHASLQLGIIALERGDSLSSLRAFNAHIQNQAFGDDKVYSKDLARLGLAMGHMRLFRPEEAWKALDDLEKITKNEDLRVEAAYRKGDVFGAKKPEQAIAEYLRAQTTYPSGHSKYPSATFNLAESYFLSKKYKESLDGFREHVKIFPGDSFTPFAMTRVGELLEILGADSPRVIGAFLETYFRYGENPKAIVARLRLLSARMKGMRDKEVENAVKQIMSLAKTSDLPNIEQFATVLIADGYTNREEFQRSIDLLTRYYQENPMSPDLDLIKKRIVRNIAEKFRGEVESGSFIDALKTHQKYADNWLKSADRPDTKYFLGRAYELAGDEMNAETRYRDVLNRLYAAKGTPEEKNLAVFDHLPTPDRLNLRLAAVELQQNKLQQAYEHLRQIKKTDGLTEDEQIERVQMAVQLLDHRGDLESATRYLTELLKNWKGQPALVAGPLFQLAEIEMRQGRNAEASRSLEQIDQLMKDSSLVPVDLHARALEKLADLQLGDKQVSKAVESYGRLLDLYEEKRPLASIRYRLGRIHFDRGEIQKASETWNGFKGERAEFWDKIAKDQLADSEWRDDYKKYMKRLPAMAR